MNIHVEECILADVEVVDSFSNVYVRVCLCVSHGFHFDLLHFHLLLLQLLLLTTLGGFLNYKREGNILY